MSDVTEPKRSVVDFDSLPELFPTHRHPPLFWENLGRVVATFGFLEQVLGQAIFSLTATRLYEASELDAAFKTWLATLERALSDPLGNLIDSYGKALREHSDKTISNPDDLIAELRKAAVIRNVLCHGSWRAPDDQGKSVPFFVNRKVEVFDVAVDVDYLVQVQAHAAELAGHVMSTITQVGWQFPGSNSPGKPIF